MWPGRRLQRFGLHKALNSVCQNSAATELKMSMKILYYEHRQVPHFPCHDEIGASVIDIEEAKVYKEVMETAVELEVPMVCDAGLGPSWGDAKEKVL
jgi:DNA polymerase I-like protein with 3'-5' exonuclease and polymerase domains